MSGHATYRPPHVTSGGKFDGLSSSCLPDVGCRMLRYPHAKTLSLVLQLRNDKKLSLTGRAWKRGIEWSGRKRKEGESVLSNGGGSQEGCRQNTKH